MTTQTIKQHKTLLILVVLVAALVAACASPVQSSSPTQAAQPQPAATTASAAPTAEAAATSATDPILIGVSGPLTGPNAQYGAQWKKGFDLALEEINGAGGINGRKLQYTFEDSQSDPKQSVVVAQKFVADPRIVVELGDFSSGASMAASQIYQRGGLVQFGFTNSHPDFTKAGGDYTWSNSVTQLQASPALADFAVNKVGLKKIAVLRLNTDWGKTTNDLFSGRIKELGADVVATEAYLPDEKDFRSALTRIRDANPDGIALISYQADGALIAQQLQDAGLKLPIVGGASLQSPDYIKLGGKAVEGTYILGEFLPSDPRPEVKVFVDKYKAKYNEEPDLFATIAYDTIRLIAKAIEVGGPTRQGIHDALPQLKDVPSVLYGKVTFDTATRRVQNPTFNNLIVKDGQFVPWDGTKPAAQ
jgi:branched-chain amino acid transport system substrate-binding protein